jgi:VacB/RNase II family 3'-5' exoribonuclease
MTDSAPTSDRSRLRAIAFRAMRDRGLDPDFPAEAIAQAEAAPEIPPPGPVEPRDLRAMLWCSIDNDDSRDLDQLSVAEPGKDGRITVRVAIADVDAQVPKDSPIDRYAALNTTSVYTPAMVFPMLPMRLSTDLTSLNQGEDRAALVVEMHVAPDGGLETHEVYRALVRNHAKLTYRSVGAWLGDQGPVPQAAAAISGLVGLLELQAEAARRLSERRHEMGALEFDRLEASVEFDGETLRDVRADEPNPAKALIENFMIAANGINAKFLDDHGVPSIRRVVRQPKRWSRIVEIAAAAGGHLPATPDPQALAQFLKSSHQSQPDRFADLSLSVIKLLGRGEYVVDLPGQDPPGHFGLAVQDYAHSTAPNRRYPDLITQRLIKAVLAGQPAPYTTAALERLAAHCTQQEDNANKVERQVDKSAAALLMASRVGQSFSAIVTGASPKGTFVRVFSPPVEGMLAHGEIPGVDVGDRLQVKLDRVDVERGFIDFSRS